jgi:hypothetical protein
MFKATQGSFLARTRENAAQVHFGANCGRAATAWEDRSPGLPQRALIPSLLRVENWMGVFFWQGASVVLSSWEADRRLPACLPGWIAE